MAVLTPEARAANLLAMAGRRLREVPSLHHDVSVALAEQCERCAGELRAALDRARRAPDGPGDACDVDRLADEGRG